MAASLAIGIADYVHQEYRESHNRLLFAAEDAVAFDAYVRAAWGTVSPEHHRLLLDRSATLESVEAAATTLSMLGRIDVLLVYLSGHGATDGHGRGWFCLADAEPGKPSLDATLLERILRPINAVTTLLFLDCCFAEAVLSDNRFFSTLGSGRTRLFICSARAGQRAWEEDRLRRSIFSHFLLLGLSTVSTVADASGHVDVESALYPYLRDQVPLRVYARKRGVAQEPVKGGLTSAQIKLPTVAGRSMGRQMSVLDSVKARLRRIIVFAALGTAIAFAFLDITVYHVTLGPKGRLEIRPGPRALFNAVPFHLMNSVDTGIAASDLNMSDKAVVRLAEGDIWGLQTRRDHEGMRDWLAKIEPDLSSVNRRRILILTSGRLPADGDQIDPEFALAPLQEMVFLRETSSQDAEAIAARLYRVPYQLEIDCNVDPKTRLDVRVLNPPSDVFGRDLLWLAVTLFDLRKDLVDRIDQIVKLTAYRAVHNQRPDVEADPAESNSCGQALTAIARIDREHALTIIAEHAPHFWTMENKWCRLPTLLALGLLGDSDTRQRAEAKLVDTVLTYDGERQGDILNRDQSTALNELRILAMRRALVPDTLHRISALITEAKNGRRPLAVVEWLGSVATTQALPNDVIMLMELNLKQGGPTRDSVTQLEAFRVLARASQLLSDEKVAELRGWASANINASHNPDELAEGLGYLGARISIPDDWLLALANQIKPDVYFSSAQTTARGTRIIRVSDEAAGIALGRVAQSRGLDEKLRDLLVRFALARRDIPERDEVLKGLAATLPYKDLDIVYWIHRQLLRTRSDSERRQLEVDVGVQLLFMEPITKRDELLKGLRERWKSEPEPEIRLALAELIARTSLKALLRETD
jgi:Caspase domain